MITPLRDNYSSDVELWLISQGRQVPLAKIGPDYVMLATPMQLSGGGAIIRMSVDGEPREWPVTIEDVVPFDNRVSIRDVE